MNLFEILSEKYVLPPKPKLFESFAGIGCQRMAFDRLGIDYESVGISEIDKYAIKSYMAIHGETPNYGDITKINGYQLPTIDVFTYSFPCTDLSKAGKQKGLSQTRSGLVYEVLRILHELKDLHNLPEVLIMENVVDLVQTKFIREFNEIQLELESLGYSNYVETMNAKEYGVAQNRDRVFMVSILGDYYYEFPKKIKLEKRLKDYLESEVDEKYYINDYQSITKINEAYSQLNGGKWDNLHDISRRTYRIDGESPTIHTSGGGQQEPKVTLIGNINPSGNGMNGNVYQGNLSPTLTTNKGEGIKIVEPKTIIPFGSYYTWKDNQGNINTQCNRAANVDECALTVACAEPGKVLVKEATEQGYAEAYEGDSINLAQPNSKTRRERVGKQVSQTLTTMNQIAVVEPNIRIRKLTPRECGRLMGVSDDVITKMLEVVSNSQAYKQFGNGIVVDVFAAILNQMKGKQNE